MFLVKAMPARNQLETEIIWMFTPDPRAPADMDAHRGDGSFGPVGKVFSSLSFRRQQYTFRYEFVRDKTGTFFDRNGQASYFIRILELGFRGPLYTPSMNAAPNRVDWPYRPESEGALERLAQPSNFDETPLISFQRTTWDDMTTIEYKLVDFVNSDPWYRLGYIRSLTIGSYSGASTDFMYKFLQKVSRRVDPFEDHVDEEGVGAMVDAEYDSEHDSERDSEHDTEHEEVNFLDNSENEDANVFNLPDEEEDDAHRRSDFWGHATWLYGTSYDQRRVQARTFPIAAIVKQKASGPTLDIRWRNPASEITQEHLDHFYANIPAGTLGFEENPDYDAIFFDREGNHHPYRRPQGVRPSNNSKSRVAPSRYPSDFS
ncbi:MAG: hypothetical protein M1833_005207 [Piccolia ochrophora]|nr:MAG: hypothetical protein M1833_005207 [Piccolia ochrophora]